MFYLIGFCHFFWIFSSLNRVSGLYKHLIIPSLTKIICLALIEGTNHQVPDTSFLNPKSPTTTKINFAWWLRLRHFLMKAEVVVHLLWTEIVGAISGSLHIKWPKLRLNFQLYPIRLTVLSCIISLYNVYNILVLLSLS